MKKMIPYLLFISSQQALSDGAVCILIDPESSCPIYEEAKEEIAIDVTSTKDLLDPYQMINEDSADSASSAGLTASSSKEFSIYTIPFSLGDIFGLGLTFSIPYIKTSEAEGIGHAFAGLTYTLTFEPNALYLVGGAILPTGDEEVSIRKEKSDSFFLASFKTDIKRKRVLFSASKTIRHVDSNNLNRGDTNTYFIGGDFPILKTLRVYSSLFILSNQDDYIETSSLGNRINIGNFSLGLVLKFFSLRIGFTTPLWTVANYLQNKDRTSTIDIGTRFSL